MNEISEIGQAKYFFYIFFALRTDTAFFFKNQHQSAQLNSFIIF